MEEKTEIKPSLTDPNTSTTDPEDSDKAKEISPPSNLPKETSKPVPVPVVNYAADEPEKSEDISVNEDASAKNKIPEIAKEVKEIAKEIDKIDKEEDSTKKMVEDADLSGPLDFETLKPESAESEPSEPELPKLEPEIESEPEIKTSESEPETSEEALPIKISTTSSPTMAKHLDTPKPINETTPIASNTVSSLTKKEDDFTNELKNIRQGKERKQPANTGSSNNAGSGIKKTIILAVSVLILLTIGAGAYYYFKDIPKEQSDAFDLEIKPATNEPLIPQDQKIITKNQFELTTESNTIEISTISELNEKITEFKNMGMFGNILAQSMITLNGETIALSQLEEAIGLVIPAEIAKSDSQRDRQFALLTIEEEGIIKTGLIIETTSSPELVKSQMLEWEKTMVGDLRSLLLGEIAEDPANPEDFRFRDSDKFPNGRFINLSESKNISIDYSILADKILIGTSYTTVENLVKLLEK